jgi:hypothetical protein
MSFAPQLSTLRTGLVAGFIGSLAEVGWVSLYADVTGEDTREFVRGMTTAAGVRALLPAHSPAIVAIGVNLAFDLVLGVVLAFAWHAVRANRKWTSPFPFMLAAMACVWAINFFVVLPIASPGLNHIVPYTVSLISALLFGVAVAAVVREEILPVTTTSP